MTTATMSPLMASPKTKASMADDETVAEQLLRVAEAREAVERLENEQREVLEGLKEIEEDENFLIRAKQTLADLATEKRIHTDAIRQIDEDRQELSPALEEMRLKRRRTEADLSERCADRKSVV